MGGGVIISRLRSWVWQRRSYKRNLYKPPLLFNFFFSCSSLSFDLLLFILYYLFSLLYTMPSMQAHTLKWALPKKPGYRIQKQATRRVLAKSNSAPLGTTEMERLASELAFTYDHLATISVHFESLQLAYTQADLNEHYSATRLGPKEKELLAAYDDLGLQVVHLERKIQTLETRLHELRTHDARALFRVSASLLALWSFHCILFFFCWYLFSFFLLHTL